MSISELNLLFNTCNEEILIETSTGKYIQLPRAPRPELLCAPDKPEPVVFTVPTLHGTYPEQVPSVGKTFTLPYYKEVRDYGILDEPEPLPHVFFLVEAEDLLQFPDREDFVCPAIWAMVRKKDAKKGMSKKKWQTYRESLPYKQREELKKSDWVSVLAGVTRHPYAVKTSDSVHLEL